MPITIQASEGLYDLDAERTLFADVMESFLRITGGAGNPFITPNLIGDGVTIPRGRSYAGGVPDDYVAVGLKVPSFALTEIADREQFVKEATDAVERAVEGRLPRDRIFVNLIYGDDFWGIGGKLYTTQSLHAAIVAASPEPAATGTAG